MRVGLDVGSTTIKCVVLDDRNNLIYHTYERHYSHIVEKSAELLRRVAERCGREAESLGCASWWPLGPGYWAREAVAVVVLEVGSLL